MTTPKNVKDARARAWKTRRKKYGPKGNSGPSRLPGSYQRRCKFCGMMRAAIVRLYDEEVLSEGQAEKLTGLDRVELRRMADELRQNAACANDRDVRSIGNGS